MRFRQSHAKVLLSHCPAVLKHMIDKGHHPTKAMDAGSLVDLVLFRRHDLYEQAVAFYKSGPRKGEPCIDWTSVDARTAREEIRARGKLPVLQWELDAAEEAAEPIRKKLDELAQGCILLEQPRIEWVSDAGTECEGTPDAVIVRRDDLLTTVTVVDIKRTDPRPKKLANQVNAMHWALQAAAYREAVLSAERKMNTGEVVYRGHIILTVDPDGIVTPCARKLAPAYLEIGRRQWERGQAIWKQCQGSGEWPGYDEVDIDPPIYVTRTELETFDFPEES